MAFLFRFVSDGFDQLAFGVVNAPLADLLIVGELAHVIQRAVGMITLPHAGLPFLLD